MRFFIGFILIIIGILLVWKTEPIVGFAGYSDWAERNLGTEGGTRLMYKLIGIGFIFLGMLAITGLYQGFMEGTVGALFVPKGR